GRRGRWSWWGFLPARDPGHPRGGVRDSRVRAPPQELGGDEELRRARVSGDFIVREGAPAEKVIARLQEILRTECKLPVTLTFREAERKVFVARGKFKLTPLPNQREGVVQVFAVQLVPDSGAGGGGGDLGRVFQMLGGFIDRRIVSEVEGAPAGEFSWLFHQRSPSTQETRRQDTNPEAVLHNVAVQTGLEFKEETRKARVLFVERAPDQRERPKER